MPHEGKDHAPEDTVRCHKDKRDFRNLLEQVNRKRAKQEVVRVLEHGAHGIGSACQAGAGGELIEI